MRVGHINNMVFNSITYILSEPTRNEVWLVDCGDVEKLDPSIPVAGVLLTHTHFDHIYGLNKLLERWPGAKVFTNEYGKVALGDARLNMSHYYGETPDFVLEKPENVVFIDESTSMKLLGHKLEILSVPGHDASCFAFIIDGNLFTGDSYIPGHRVVTNLPRCDKKQALQSEAFLQQIELKYKLFPGHFS